MKDWNDVQVSLYYSKAEENSNVSLSLMPLNEHILHLIEVLLDSSYIAMIVICKGLSLQNFGVTAYATICAAALGSKAISLYREYSRMRKAQKAIMQK